MDDVGALSVVLMQGNVVFPFFNRSSASNPPAGLMEDPHPTGVPTEALAESLHASADGGGMVLTFSLWGALPNANHPIVFP